MLRTLLKQNKRLLLLWGLSLVLIGAAYVFLYMPKARRIARLDQELKPLLAQIAVNQEKIGQVPNLDEEIIQLKHISHELNEKASSKEEIPKIIQQLARQMTKFNISAVSIKPREDLAAVVRDLPDGVSKVFLEVKMECVYKSLGRYIESLQELPILFTVEDITVEKVNEVASDDVRVVLILSTYVVT